MYNFQFFPNLITMRQKFSLLGANSRYLGKKGHKLAAVVKDGKVDDFFCVGIW